MRILRPGATIRFLNPFTGRLKRGKVRTVTSQTQIQTQIGRLAYPATQGVAPSATRALQFESTATIGLLGQPTEHDTARGLL